MAKTGKVLQALCLFGDGRKQLRVAELAKLLDVANATAYRYVADLEAAGFIESASQGSYVLGPAIVELDREIRINDPLIAAASEVMKTLSERSGATVLLSRLHGRKVVCVSEIAGRFGPLAVSYERGRAMPLYRGATSKVIFAQMSALEVAEIATADPAGLLDAGLPAVVEDLMKQLGDIGSQKVYATAGEVDQDAMGWAVAIHHGKHLLGSLSALCSRSAPEASRQRIADQLLWAGLRIEGRLESVAGR